MDSEITSLAHSGAATLVTLMATEAWQIARERLVSLWRAVQPHNADAVGADLDAGRAEVAAASVAGDQQVLDDVRAEWRSRLRRLLAVCPEAATELRRLLDDVGGWASTADVAIAQRATASGHARVYQAGRDQHITER